MPNDAFYATVLEAKRWGGVEAAARGVAQRAVPGEHLHAEAFAEAAKLAKLTSAGAFGYTKWRTKGFVAKEILEHTFPGGRHRGRAALSPGLQEHVQRVVVEGKAPWSARLGSGAARL